MNGRTWSVGREGRTEIREIDVVLLLIVAHRRPLASAEIERGRGKP